MKNKITVSDIQNLSYTEFLGLVNQWNVPPGAYETVNRWVKFSNMNDQSNVLEIACTTGFSLREASAFSGCTGVGIDISEKSIDKAVDNGKYNKKIRYMIEDAYDYKPSERFSHIIIGASLRFFDNPKKILNRCCKDFWLNDGYLLSCEFYVNKPIPEDLVDEAYKIFGIKVTQLPYKEVMSVYEGLEMIYEDRKKPIPETEKELKYYCECTIDRAMKDLNITDNSIYQVCFDRLYKIKDMSNKLRNFQNYNILVHRYRKNLFPNRFVELF